MAFRRATSVPADALASYGGWLPLCTPCGEFVEDCACVCSFCGELARCHCCIGPGVATGGD